MINPLLWILLLAPQDAPAQPPQTPFKAGLWEITSVLSHPEVGSAAPAPQPTKRQMCITPQVAPPALLGAVSKLCTSSNISKQPGHISMDLACRGMSSHVDIETFSPDLTRSTIRATVTNGAHTSVVNNVTEYHFLNPSCGSLQPGQAVPVQ